jgi:menaquinol-cytochrome c reductase iron-sulfur subunit
MDPTSTAEPRPSDSPATSSDPELLRRRRFLTRVSVGLSAVVATIVGIPFVGFLMSPLMRKPPRQWRGVGRVDQFRIGDTVQVQFEDASPLPWAGVTARTAAWLRRDDANRFTAFSVHCTHLGCPVRWFTEARLFLCPCHGGVYYDDGTVAGGPPPKPLARYPTRVRDGQVEILTSPIPIA